MLYSILIYVPEDLVDAMSKQEEDAHIARHLKVHEKLSGEGRLGPCVRLMPTTAGACMRRRSRTSPGSAHSRVTRSGGDLLEGRRLGNPVLHAPGAVELPAEPVLIPGHERGEPG